MGLDMYLNQKRFFEGEEKETIEKVSKVKGSGYTTSVEVEVAYWRKANAIHKFLIELDDQETRSYVEIEDLKRLLELCKKVKSGVRLVKGKVANGYSFDEKGNKVYDYEDGEVIENPELCEALLPTMAGFFFGSTDYDEWYMDQIDHTIEQLERVIENYKDGDSFEYIASW